MGCQCLSMDSNELVLMAVLLLKFMDIAIIILPSLETLPLYFFVMKLIDISIYSGHSCDYRLETFQPYVPISHVYLRKIQSYLISSHPPRRVGKL